MLSELLEGCIRMMIQICVRRRRVGRRKRENGFTMLEILASIALLSITIIPLLGLLAGSLVSHAQREQQLRAAFLAQKRLEEVKDEILSNDLVGDYNEAATAFPAPDLNYKYIVTVTDDADIRNIAVRVWFDENGNDVRDGGEQEFGLRGRAARRGPLPAS
jgi:prepilin-type N-terminal cleavage/methylation domain-containing protein